jgi:hypothetical protein
LRPIFVQFVEEPVQFLSLRAGEWHFLLGKAFPDLFQQLQPLLGIEAGNV